MGNVLAFIAPNSQLSLQYPPPPKFNPARDIPDLAGKVAIVTGGNSGIGYHTVKELLLKNAKVYLAARSPDKCIDAVKQLKKETNGREPVILQMDLADLPSVRKAADEFLGKEERLDILFNNAGLMIPPSDMLTAQGYDLQFGTHVMGHYFFTKLLRPALQRSYAHHGVKARIINTASSGHSFAPGPTGIEWAAIKGGAERDAVWKRWGESGGRWKAYGASKFGNIVVSNILNKEYGDFVVSCSLHPGGLSTGLQRHAPGWQQFILKNMLHPAKFGAYTQLWAGTTGKPEDFKGKYLIPWGRIGKADSRASNVTTQEELLDWLEEQIKDF